MKLCRVCKKVKKSSKFNQRDDGQSGLKWACKICQKLKGKESDCTRYKKMSKNPEWVKRLNKRRRELWKIDFKRNPKKFLDRAKEWRELNPERLKEVQHKQRMKYRMGVLRAYSGKNIQCRCCKIRDIDLLVVDHINGGGNQHLKKLKKEGKLLYIELMKQGYPKGYQILCHNCNYKKYLRGRCYHKK